MMGASEVVTHINGRNQFVSVFSEVIHVGFTWNPHRVRRRKFVSERIKVPGAKLGDFSIISCDVDLRNMIISSHVSVNDSVDVQLTNPTSRAVNLGKTRTDIVLLRTHHK